MTIKLPRNLVFDLDEIPDEFEQIISRSFGEFTKGTSSDYRYQDKLLYIDHCVRLLHGDKTTNNAVRELIHEQVDYQLDEDGTMPDKSDFMGEEFMEQCYEKGLNSARLYSEYQTRGGRTDEKILKLLCRIIKTVICWEA